MAKIRNNIYTLEVYRNKKYVRAFQSNRPSQVFIRAAMRKQRLRIKCNDEVIYKKVAV